MSDASSTAPQTSAPEVRARYQRSARNYLIDQNFQLKYTGFLVGISLALSVALDPPLERELGDHRRRAAAPCSRDKRLSVRVRRPSSAARRCSSRAVGSARSSR